MGIPCIYGVDQIHGTTYTLGGTFFPQGINMAATFNRELVREGARISAYETKAGSIPRHTLPCSTSLAMPAGPVIGKIMARIAM